MFCSRGSRKSYIGNRIQSTSHADARKTGDAGDERNKTEDAGEESQKTKDAREESDKTEDGGVAESRE
ncbi:unnamed protein product [Prunus armeniaca]|uniref:Uncharacterized protein n=1 Tax=Prunus armeniaca TaxID=36596 RepID=A0A6J5Y7P0_PRUAR|nr:unnamed protein product [Prunus armeniaca]CAB4320005.1 unnamed protein product [Prunus armeniaca]